MRIKSLRIQNYKSFADSDLIELTRGFNLVIGKNSSGKTALLESLNLHLAKAGPHRSEKQRPGTPLPPSKFDLELVFDTNELMDALLRMGGTNFPVNGDDAHAVSLVHKFFMGAETAFKLNVLPGGPFNNSGYPSHGLFIEGANRSNIKLLPDYENQTFKIGLRHNNENDTLLALATDLLIEKLYVFKAERLNIGEIGFAEDSKLAPNAANLPRVLDWMSTNPALFARYNAHVNQIFPYIKAIIPVPKGNNIEIRIWWTDTKTERADLAIPLAESGTGIGQALAILYVAMTMRRGIIVIDEPNSFLHPGAAKTLIEILGQYDHQYLISTHSSELMAVANPNSIFITHWEDGATRVERIERMTLESQRRILKEVGISASDVFGADKIVWVEGPTEAECFPLILQHRQGAVPQGIDFVAVRSTDELVRKQKTDQLVLDIYNKLSDRNALLPEAICFSFDREKRSPQQISQIEQGARGQIRFLPARCYECFLLHLEALTAVINSHAASLGKAQNCSPHKLNSWLSENAPRFQSGAKWNGTIDADDWRKSVDAPELLNTLFKDFTVSEYDKVRDSRSLTQWLLDNDPKSLDVLSDYVAELIVGR